MKLYLNQRPHLSWRVVFAGLQDLLDKDLLELKASCSQTNNITNHRFNLYNRLLVSSIKSWRIQMRISDCGFRSQLKAESLKEDRSLNKGII